MNRPFQSAIVRFVLLLLAAPAWAQTAAPPVTPAPAVAAAPRDLETLRAAAQERLTAWVARTGAPGATLAAVLPDGREIAVAARMSRLADSTPMQPSDRMFSGSIGKTYFAAATLQLVHEGKAGLDAKLSTWLGDRPWFARLPNSADLTLRMVMNHTSGIAEHVTSPAFTAALKAEPQKSWSPDQLIAFALDKEPLFEAGKGWSYADTNYILVGMVIEKVSGRSAYEEVERRILSPLKLVDTAPSDKPALRGLITGHCGPGNPFTDREEVATAGVYFMNPQFEWCGGGFISTAPDLARWAKHLYAGEVLAPALKEQMLQGVKAKTGPRDEYGLGVQLWPTARGRAIGHSGWFPGYTSTMAYYPDLGIAIAVQVNTDNPRKSGGLRALLTDTAGALAGPERADP